MVVVALNPIAEEVVEECDIAAVNLRFDILAYQIEGADVREIPREDDCGDMLCEDQFPKQRYPHQTGIIAVPI